MRLSFLPVSANRTNPNNPLWDNASRLARFVYRARPYSRIAWRAWRRRVRVSDLARTQFPFLLPDARTPPTLTVEFTNSCNLRCAYCVFLAQKDEKGVMPRDTFDRVLEDVRRYGIERVRIVGNGEPTLHPEFATYVGDLRRATKFLSIVTNAHWPGPEIATALIEAPVDLVEISIDGGGKAQYEASRERAKYDRLMHSLKTLYHARNAAGARTMINIRLMVRPSNRHLVKQETGLYLRYSDTVMPQYLQMMDPSEYQDDIYMPSYRHSNEWPKCSMPFKHIEVLWNGNIPLCGPNGRGVYDKRLCLGNINEVRLGQVWNGPVYRQYRGAHRKRSEGDMPVCQGCPGI